MKDGTIPVPRAQAATSLMAEASGPFADTWRLYRQAGWLGTLQVPKLAKTPVPPGFTGYNGKWPEERQLLLWAATNNANIAIRLPTTVIGIDVDHGYPDKQGRIKKGADDIAALEAELGPLPPTWVSTSRGPGKSHIKLYRVPEGPRWPTELGADVEIIQHDHRYAIVWPSVVAARDGGPLRTYRWYEPGGEATERPPAPSELAELPPAWVGYLAERGKATRPEGPAVCEEDLPPTVRFPGSLAEVNSWMDRMLLSKSDPGRGDDTAVAVAGGVVRLCLENGLPFKLALAVAYNYDQGSDDPQHRQIVHDKVARMWAQTKAALREEAVEQFDESTGYLRDREEGHGYTTLANNRLGKPEEVPFSDFKVRATGVHTDNGRTVWTIDLERKDGKVFTDVELPSEILSSASALRQWAMGYRCSIYFSNDKDPRGHAGIRLQALMESQRPVDCRVISHLGYDEESQGFVTYEGLITPTGVDPTPTVRPSRELARNNLVNHFYGFRPEREVKDVLREVLTFHDETFTSLLTSWLMAGVLKGPLMRKSSLFPIFLVEAVSESGKTKGFAQLIHQMFGNKSAEGGIGTMASTRDALAAHRGAPVHIDDADSLKHIEEILRQATVEGTVDKKGGDFRGTVRAKLLAPVWISCENSGLHGEKALPDRMIRVDLPNPKGRMSLKDPNRKQWFDILDMMEKYPSESGGLTVMAGTLVQLIMQRAHMIDQFEQLAKSAGRFGDKMAVLRIGARILADITGDQRHVERVDAWTFDQVDTGAENSLTLRVVPAAVNVFGAQRMCTRIDSAPHYGFATPVIVAPPPGSGPDVDDAMWVHVASLGGWWAKHNGGKISQRTETIEALEDQAKALGMRGRRTGERNVDWAQFDCATTSLASKRQRILYLRVPDIIAQRILAAHGTEVGSDSESDPRRLNPAQMEAIARSADR